MGGAPRCRGRHDHRRRQLTQIATLRIELDGTEPPIWRVVEVPTSITLKVLHDIVHAAMGWLDYYLWELVIDGLPMDEDWGTKPRKVPARTRLRDVLALGTTRLHLRLRRRLAA